MTLTTGTLYLVGASQATTASIEYELTGVRNGYTLLTAISDSGESYNSMRDFAGYSACSDTTPTTPTSVAGVDSGPYATCTYSNVANADNHRVQYSISPFTVWNPSTSGGAYDLASPYTTTLGNGTWRFRVCGENCSGLGAYRTSASFTMS